MGILLQNSQRREGDLSAVEATASSVGAASATDAKVMQASLCIATRLEGALPLQEALCQFASAKDAKLAAELHIKIDKSNIKPNLSG